MDIQFSQHNLLKRPIWILTFVTNQISDIQLSLLVLLVSLSLNQWNTVLITTTLQQASITGKTAIFFKDVLAVSILCLVAQLCPTLCDSLDCSPPGSSVHGIFQARILDWVAISFSRGSSWPKHWTCVSCIAGRFFTSWVVGKALAVSI